MRLAHTLTTAAQTLDLAQIPFALIGGFALAAHGVARTTEDIDVLVEGSLRDKTDIQMLIETHSDLDYKRVKIYADLFGEWSTIEALRSLK